MQDPTNPSGPSRFPFWGAVVALFSLSAALFSAPAQAGPSSSERPPEETAAQSLVTATWVGFRRTGPKSALVYVQLTDAVEVKTSKTAKTVTVTLRKTRVQIKNNRNPLLASHFESVVESARLVPKGQDLELLIQLKRDAEVTARVEKESQGAVLLVELSEP